APNNHPPTFLRSQERPPRRNELATPIDGRDSVLSRQFDQPITLAQEKIFTAYHECAEPLSDNGRESRIDLAGSTCFQNRHAGTEGTCRILYDGSFSCRLANVSRVEENGDRGCWRHHVVPQLKRLRAPLHVEDGTACDVAAGLCDPPNPPPFDHSGP